MSRLEELKKQNISFNSQPIDIINNVYGKTKYTEMVINLLKNQFKSDIKNTKYVIEDLVNDYKFDRDELNLNSFEENYSIYRVIRDYIGYEYHNTIKKFIELNERNLIDNKDLTSYKSFVELERQVSLGGLKLIDKEMEKQVKKLYEDDEWLVLKPLSYLSSLKYGSGTKWCTASEGNSEYYFKYSKRGILIYNINKKTGDKVASFKSVDYEKETSFWNDSDQRIDSMESGLPINIIEVIKNEFFHTSQSNWDILSDDEKNKQTLWIEENLYSNKLNIVNELEVLAEINPNTEGLIIYEEVPMPAPSESINFTRPV